MATPVEDMNVQALKQEIRERDKNAKVGGVNRADLARMLYALRSEEAVTSEMSVSTDSSASGGQARVDTDASPEEPEEIEGEAVEETPDEAEREHLLPAVAEQVREAESLALELRERAVGPQATMPAVAELNAMRALAEQLAHSRIVPSAFYNKPDDIIAATLMGRELGIGPMQSLKDIAVIDGRPALAAHLQLALLRRGGLQILESSVTDDRAYIKARRSDTGEVAEIEWTYAEAERVKRKGKPLVDGDNWRNYRQDMLWARAVGRLTRRIGSDLVAGMPYTAEEVRDFSDDPYGYGATEMTTHVVNAPEPNVPTSIQEITSRMSERLGQEEAVEWLREAVIGWAGLQHATVERWSELSPALKKLLGQKLATVVLDLERRETETGEDLRLSTGVREKVAQVFAKRLDGLALTGPPWRLGPDELGLPTHAQVIGGSAFDQDGDIEFPDDAS